VGRYLPVYVNGVIVPEDQARVSVFDRGFTRGDGVFETLRTYGGRPFRLDRHLARLDRGLEVLRFAQRSADLGLAAAVESVVRASGLASARMRVQVTRGAGSTAFSTAADTPPTVVVTVHPLDETATEPIRAIISSIRRDHLSPLAGIKTINYIPSILARMEAEDIGADDAIMLNYAGMVVEGCASNVFVVRDGALFTPDLASGALPGVTREAVLQIAADLGIPSEERPIDIEFLTSADEIFLTSTTKEVVPVATLNGKQVGQGGHEVTKLLAGEFHNRASRSG